MPADGEPEAEEDAHGDDLREDGLLDVEPGSTPAAPPTNDPMLPGRPAPNPNERGNPSEVWVLSRHHRSISGMIAMGLSVAFGRDVTSRPGVVVAVVGDLACQTRDAYGAEPQVVRRASVGDRRAALAAG